ncbi:hypothetical protein WHI96_07910 [Pseudonocardia tropica]|uniref:Phage tail protein n=1 Tax=Pseudonocardia tropica TaxID=681289 RepID=A0ABV1JUB9_9PSEU
MPVSVSNLTQGPGVLYAGVMGATEPTDATTAPATGASGYTDVGGTNDGVQLSIKQTYKELEVDQVVDIPGRRITKREMTLKTNLAEPTLENLAISLNSAASAITTAGTGANATKSFEPPNEGSATQPIYRPLVFDGFAPGAKTDGTAPARRILVRRALSTDDVSFAYKKDDQTVFSVTFSAHYVSASIKAFKVIDQVLA